MDCPQCGERTEVTEKRGPFRERHCTNSACGLKFTTREHVIPQQEQSHCARTRAKKIGAVIRAKEGGKRPPLTGEPSAADMGGDARRHQDNAGNATAKAFDPCRPAGAAHQE